ncbi:protein phosphatase 1 regulatory subunit INH3 [Aristolochia californica]|uniref:protein phosphatase 1 regulatory subunit INH3 n=1 Tax=Aristolochia californica TaxID=171875 RepID=UPI0035D82F21
MERSLMRTMSSTTATTVLTLDDSSFSSSAQNHLPQQSLTLRLSRRLKKKVSWKEGTVDNEFLQRKSSKKCCIFHKQKQFDEDNSDDDDDHDNSKKNKLDEHGHCEKDSDCSGDGASTSR